MAANAADLAELREVQRRIRLKTQYYLRGEQGRHDRDLLRGGAGAEAISAERRRLKAGPLKRRPGEKYKPVNLYTVYDNPLIEPKLSTERLRDRNRQKEIRLGKRVNYSGKRNPQKALWRRAGNAAVDLARNLGRHRGPNPLRFVKILGAGGLGFVVLFDARVESPAQGGDLPEDLQDLFAQFPEQNIHVPWDVNFYVCKSVLRNKIISPQRQGDRDPAIVSAMAKYEDQVMELRREKRTQLELAGCLHVVQAYGRAHRRQVLRHRANLTTRAVAAEADVLKRLNHWLNKGGRAWTDWLRPQARILERRAKAPPRTVRTRNQQPETWPRPEVPLPGINRPPRPENAGRYYNAGYAEHSHVRLGRDTVADDQNMLFIEYVPRGDLKGFIAKMNSMNEPEGELPPNRILWSIWECLLRMVAALYKPVRGDRAQSNQDIFGPLESEQMGNPTRELLYLRTQNKNYIHFDIDPQNIFVGPLNCTGIRRTHLPGTPAGHKKLVDDPNVHMTALPAYAKDQREDGHAYCPLFKLADFGLAESWRPEDGSGDLRRQNLIREKHIFETRVQGKRNYRLPEQFTTEWDWVNRFPISHAEAQANAHAANLAAAAAGQPAPRPPPDNLNLTETPVEIAGLYSWKSNLYQFALTMFAVITGFNPPEPPVANEVIKTTTTANPDGTHTTTQSEIYSYGGYLLDDEQFPLVDRALRETVVLCLAEKPDERPSYPQLMEQVRQKMSYFAAVHRNRTTNPPQAPDDWEARLPNGDPPSERVKPDMDTMRVWSEGIFEEPPRPKLIPSADYKRWIDGIVTHQQRLDVWVHLKNHPHLYPDSYSNADSENSVEDEAPDPGASGGSSGSSSGLSSAPSGSLGPYPGSNPPGTAPPPTSLPPGVPWPGDVAPWPGPREGSGLVWHRWYPGDYEYTVDLRHLPLV